MVVDEVKASPAKETTMLGDLGSLLSGPKLAGVAHTLQSHLHFLQSNDIPYRYSKGFDASCADFPAIL
jgi:hypothetical protein